MFIAKSSTWFTVTPSRRRLCRYEEAGNTLDATVVHDKWGRRSPPACSTDATGAAIQPGKREKGGTHRSCKRGHFFTVVADCDHVPFHYTETHNQATVKKLFAGYKGFLADASCVYDLGTADRHVKTTNQARRVLGHCRRYFFEAAICKYPVGVQGLMRIRAIYEDGSCVQEVSRGKRRQPGNAHLRPLIEEFAGRTGVRFSEPGKTLATKALGYAHNQAAELILLLDDLRIPLDNTRSERARSEPSSSGARTTCPMEAIPTRKVQLGSSVSLPPADSIASTPRSI
ncbi:MAG: transposase [Polyangiaceae bacterium]